MEWMLLPLKRYAEFTGRSRRKELWLWVLGVSIITFILMLLDSALGLGGSSTFGSSSSNYGTSFNAQFHGGVLTGIFSLAILIPNLAVSVRRLHDIDRTGWWIMLPIGPYLIGFVLAFMAISSGSIGMAQLAGGLMLIGLICVIILIVFYCMLGTRGPNRFGPDPLGDMGHLGETFS